MLKLHSLVIVNSPLPQFFSAMGGTPPEIHETNLATYTEAHILLYIKRQYLTILIFNLLSPVDFMLSYM